MISTLLVPEPQEVVQHAEILVIGNSSPEFRGALRPSDRAMAARYEGICW